jgi:heme/copper-type cytochrome/quinol oxidase subunit 3
MDRLPRGVIVVAFRTHGALEPDVRKPAKIILGLATVWPIVYILLFMAFVASTLIRTVQTTGAPPPDFFRIIIPLHLATMLVALGLLVFYVTHAYRSASLSSDRRLIWIVLLLFGFPIAGPIYWYSHLWHEEPRANPTA